MLLTVQTGTVPVARDGLRVPADLRAKVFGDAREKESSKPGMMVSCRISEQRRR